MHLDLTVHEEDELVKEADRIVDMEPSVQCREYPLSIYGVGQKRQRDDDAEALLRIRFRIDNANMGNDDYMVCKVLPLSIHVGK